MKQDQILLFQTEGGETKIETHLAGEVNLKAINEYDKFRERHRDQPALVEIHFPETFEAKQKHLHSQEIAVTC